MIRNNPKVCWTGTLLSKICLPVCQTLSFIQLFQLRSCPSVCCVTSSLLDAQAVGAKHTTVTDMRGRKHKKYLPFFECYDTQSLKCPHATKIIRNAHLKPVICANPSQIWHSSVSVKWLGDRFPRFCVIVIAILQRDPACNLSKLKWADCQGISRAQLLPKNVNLWEAASIFYTPRSKWSTAHKTSQSIHPLESVKTKLFVEPAHATRIRPFRGNYPLVLNFWYHPWGQELPLQRSRRNLKTYSTLLPFTYVVEEVLTAQ